MDANRYCYTVALVLNGKENIVSNEVCGNTDINEITENAGFVYPNPAEESFNISCEFDHYEIYDVTGRKIITANEMTIYVKDWKPGVYTVKIFTREGNILTTKIVKR